MKVGWSDVITAIILLGLIIMAQLQNNYEKAIFFYLIYANAERRVNAYRS